MSTLSHLADLVEGLSGARVLCVGDVMLDRYVMGAVDRISPEAPIAVLRVTHETAMLGGAGNVANNVAALGGGGDFLAVVGDDPAAREITHLLENLATVQSDLVRDGERPSTLKTRFVGANQQLMRADMESSAALPAAIETQLLQKISAHADRLGQPLGAVVLSDYGKGVLSDRVLESIINHAQNARVPVIIDPKGTDYRRYRGADIITPNAKELADASAMPVATDPDVVAACIHLIDTCGIGGVLATRSADGMTLVIKGQQPLHLKAKAREVFDVSGAGDTVVATLALALASGTDIANAAALANIAAGIVVGKSGTATLTGAELSHALHHQDLGQAEAKLRTWDQARETVSRWRDTGRKIGFTNGCFDLLHPGHIALLSQARKACDRLVVGLNCDASVRALKGDSRPVQSEAARAAVLGALAAVDLVVLFGEPTPLELIQVLRPDVLIKGADYTVKSVVGADFVQGYGGRILLADLVDGHSTTNTIKRLQS